MNTIPKPKKGADYDMLDLDRIDWRQDGITCRYVAEHKAELADPPAMDHRSLAAAATYCRSFDSPYAEELAKRAGLLEAYLRASGVERADVVRRAAKGFNILLI